MENQNQHIRGYRDLSPEEISSMNTIKDMAEDLRVELEALESLPEVDMRWLAIGKTNMQQVFPAVLRSIANGHTRFRTKMAPSDVSGPSADGLPFGLALEALKQGKSVARAGWNGKGMFLFLQKGKIDAGTFGDLAGEALEEPEKLARIAGVALDMFDANADAAQVVLPHVCMMAVGGMVVNGWLASQTDMLADDWQIV